MVDCIKEKKFRRKTDYKTCDFYKDFIQRAKQKLDELENKIAIYSSQINKTYEILRENELEIKERLNIDLTRYEEYNYKRYKAGEPLHLICRSRIEKREETFTIEDKKLMLQLIKYCSAIRRMRAAKRQHEFTKIKLKLTPRKYLSLVHTYYNKVHKYLLLGYGYKFYDTKLGVLFIMRTLRDVKNDEYNKIDWWKTKKNAELLRKQGIELYDKAKADECAKKGIPYNGVDYRVFRKNPATYRYEIRDTDIMLSPLRKIYPMCTIPDKFRGCSYEQIAKTFCKTDEDLFNLDISLYYKLPIYLCMHPEKYVNYVRTPDQRIPFNRKDYRKNR